MGSFSYRNIDEFKKSHGSIEEKQELINEDAKIINSIKNPIIEAENTLKKLIIISEKYKEVTDRMGAGDKMRISAYSTKIATMMNEIIKIIK